MKIILTLLGIIAIGFIAVQLFAMSNQKGIETYPYTVEKKYNNFEIRQYQASLFTKVTLPPSNYKNSSGSGFRMLAGYIFGGNEREEKIAMTSPVAMSLEDSMTMMFMVPSSYSMQDLPKPNDHKVKFHQEPQKRVAAITFGGWANDEKIEEHKNLLVKALFDAGIPHTNKFYFLGYNPPYEVTNRKNEVIVEL